MLVEIDAEQLAVGMYLHAIDLPWHRHPFWRRRFVIHSREEVASLIAAGAKRITIDDEKGLAPPVVDGIARSVEKDVRKPETQRKAAARSTQAFETQKHPARLTGKERAAEMRRATKILAKSKSEVMRLFDDARMGQSIKTGKVQSLVDQISDSVAKDASIILNIARLKSKDEYTFLHSVSVCALMINLGRKMGLDEAKVRELGVAGMLHDVGKMSVPDVILNKPGKLDDAEFAVIRSHPEKGHAILAASKQVSQTALDVCLLHHEKMDGSGYPHRLAADDLSLPVRMAAICDVYDAITSQRSYNRPFSGAEALAKMLSWQGHFDQLLLRTFIESLGIHPIGSIVRMGDHSLAVVIGEDPNDYTQPVVRKFYSLDHDAPVENVKVWLGCNENNESIHSVEQDLPHNIVQLGRMALGDALAMRAD